MSESADPAKPPETPAPTPAPKETTPDLGKLVADAVARHGDGTAAMKALVSDLIAEREDKQALKAKLPPVGAVVLKGDDARAWEAYASMGKPADVRKAIEDGAAAVAKAAGYEREKLHAEAAALAGYKPAVLDRLATADGLAIVLVDGKDRAGKDVKVPHVRGEGDATTPLTEYAESRWKDFLPALKGADAPRPAPAGSPGRNGQQPPRPEIKPDRPQRSLVR